MHHDRVEDISIKGQILANKLSSFKHHHHIHKSLPIKIPTYVTNCSTYP